MEHDVFATPRPAALQAPALPAPSRPGPSLPAPSLPAKARPFPGMPTTTYGGLLLPAVDEGLLPRGAPV